MMDNQLIIQSVRQSSDQSRGFEDPQEEKYMSDSGSISQSVNQSNNRSINQSNNQSNKQSTKLVDIGSAPVFTGKFIEPNEFVPYCWQAALSDAKLDNCKLITTGTFRAFFAASYGKFRSVRIVDVDPFATQFSNILIALIKAISQCADSKDRGHQFLAVINHGKWLNPDQLVAMNQMQRLLKPHEYPIPVLDLPSHVMDVNRSIVDFYHTMFAARKTDPEQTASNKKWREDCSSVARWRIVIWNKMLQYHRPSQANVDNVFWANPVLWNRLYELITSDNLHVITGNLFDQHAEPEDMDTMLVLDLSNVLEYANKSGKRICPQMENVKKVLSPYRNWDVQLVLVTSRKEMAYKRGCIWSDDWNYYIFNNLDHLINIFDSYPHSDVII